MAVARWLECSAMNPSKTGLSVAVVSRALLLSAVALLASTAPVAAVTGFHYWDGGDGFWDKDVSHWDEGQKWHNNSNAVFGGTAGTVTLTEDIAAKQINFASSGYVIDGVFELDVKDGILLQAGVTDALFSVGTMKLSKEQSWTVTDVGALLTFSAPIALMNKDVVVDGAGDVLSSGGLTGLGTLSKSGTGTLTLTGLNTFAGPTVVTNGVLAVNGTVNTSHITASVEGTLSGSGTVADVTLAIGGILSPGNGVGSLTTGNVALQGGSYFNWQISDATGVAGTGFDHVSSTGTLTIEADPLARAKFNIWSLSAPGVNGAPANFDESLAYAWEVASFGSIVNFDPASFIIVRGPAEGTGGFIGAIDGTFSLTSDGSHLVLHYAPYSLLTGGPAVWIDGTGLWSEDAKWLAAVSPTLESQTLFFAGTGGTSTHDTFLGSVSEIRFLAEAAGSYVVDGAALQLGIGGIINESAHVQTIALDLVLASNSIIVTHTAKLFVSGSIDTAGHILVVDGDHDTEITGVITGAGGVHKIDFGTLTLGADSTYTGLTDVIFGTLRIDGSIVTGVTVGAYGTLAGDGSFGGQLALAGRLAPGGSPGILTQSSGNAYLDPSSHYEVELGGVLAGAGDGFHDRFNIVAGACFIATGVTLDALPWDTALGATFVPSRGQAFTVLDARQGIFGGYTDLTNAGHAQWLLYDNNATGIRYGNLYGTGLLGAQTFADYGLSSNQAAVGLALHAAAVTASPSSTSANPAGFIDSSTTQGRVALAVLAGTSLDVFSPEAYLAVLDHAIDANRSALDAALVIQPLARSGDWSFGYTQERALRDRLGGAAVLSGRKHASDNAVLRLGYAAGPLTTLGIVLGHTQATLGAVDARGETYGLTVRQLLGADSRWSVDAGVAWSDLDFGGSRAQVLGSSVDNAIALEGASAEAQDVGARGFGCQATARLAAYRGETFSAGLAAGVVHGRARTAAFTETGSGALLAVDSAVRESTKAVAGLNLAFRPCAWFDLALSAGVEHEMGSDDTSLGATFAGESFTVTDNPIDRDTSVYGLRVSSQLDTNLFLQLGAEVRHNNSYEHDRRFSLNLSTRF